MNQSKEIEVRFLEIDKKAIIAKLCDLGAEDLGETMLEEVIIYDKDSKWLAEKKFVRVRKNAEKSRLTFKHHNAMERGEAVEIEFEIGDFEGAVSLFEALGFVAYRRQQKYRHTLKLEDVTFDIDTWPKIPPYIELEGSSIDALKKAARKLGLSWSKVELRDARLVIEQVYKIPVGSMHWFTFDRFE